MMRILALLIIAFSALPALAQQDAKIVTQMSVSLDDCKRLVRHQARDDVTYKPGVDVRGKAVKSADLQPRLGAITPPDEIVIDFGLDLAGRYGIPAAGLYDATAGIGTIQYDMMTGGLTFNGKPLLKDDSRAVARACKLLIEKQGE